MLASPEYLLVPLHRLSFPFVDINFSFQLALIFKANSSREQQTFPTVSELQQYKLVFSSLSLSLSSTPSLSPSLYVCVCICAQIYIYIYAFFCFPSFKQFSGTLSLCRACQQLSTVQNVWNPCPSLQLSISSQLCELQTSLLQWSFWKQHRHHNYLNLQRTLQTFKVLTHLLSSLIFTKILQNLQYGYSQHFMDETQHDSKE